MLNGSRNKFTSLRQPLNNVCLVLTLPVLYCAHEHNYSGTHRVLKWVLFEYVRPIICDYKEL